MRQCSFAYVLFTFGCSGAYVSPACSIYGYPQIFMAGEGEFVKEGRYITPLFFSPPLEYTKYLIKTDNTVREGVRGRAYQINQKQTEPLRTLNGLIKN
jgi:hypothetical protein